MSRDIVSEIEEADVFFPMRQWPPWARQAFVKEHKNRDERFKLATFFWKNGMMAHQALAWVMWHGGYDRDAWRSMNDWKEMTNTSAGREYLRNVPVMDITLGRVD